MVLGAHRFYMPAEWEEHQGMLMEWPVSDSVWRDDLRQVRAAFAVVANTIARFEPVFMVAAPENSEGARELCGPGVRVLEMEHDDCWARDNGPTFVFDRESRSLTCLSWDFNAWGNKYANYSLDNLVPEKLCALWNIPLEKPGMVLEGGSVHTNGRGALLVTEECLLNKNRNPRMGKDEIEAVLKRYLGADRVVWLPFGLYGDETDGHVDNVCCFIDENTVLMPWTDDPANPNTPRFARNRSALADSGFSVETLPQPDPVCRGADALTLSYVNFVFVNGAIVMPAFGGDAARTDAIALGKLRELFPNREVIPLPTLPIVWGGGNIHCVTQQIPRAEGRIVCARLL